MSEILKTLRIAIKGEEKEFTTGSIRRAIILLSIPMILEMFLEGLFAIVDAFWVGKISTEAMAVVGLTESVITIIYSLSFGMAMAATAMVARRIGEKKPKEAAKAAKQAIVVGALVSIVTGILGVIYAEDILRLMGGSDAVIETGLLYTQIMFGSNIVIVFLFLLNGIFRGAGDASLAMRTLFISNGLNIILDPIFIFGLAFIPAFGVTGAAIATTIGRSFGVGYQLYHLLGNGNSLIKINLSHFSFEKDIITRFLDISSTGSFQFIIASSSWIFLMKIISEFGDSVVAGYWLALRVIIFTILPSWGMSNAAATLMGQNLGAKKPDRAEKSVWISAWYNTLFLAIVGVFLFLFAKPIISIFAENDPVVIDTAVECLRIFCIGYLFFASGMVITQAYNGAGDTRTPTVINFFCFWILQIPLAYFLSTNLAWGPSGVYWGIAITEATLAIICVLMFRRGKWKTVEV